MLTDILFNWYYYAIGIADYVRRNNNGSPNAETFWPVFTNELYEVHDAICRFDIVGYLLELFDVLHVIIKFTLVTCTPQFIHFNPIIWALIYPLILPVSIKLGYRYGKFRCIRNHHRPNTDHHCAFISAYKSF